MLARARLVHPSAPSLLPRCSLAASSLFSRCSLAAFSLLFRCFLPRCFLAAPSEAALLFLSFPIKFWFFKFRGAGGFGSQSVVTEPFVVIGLNWSRNGRLPVWYVLNVLLGYMFLGRYTFSGGTGRCLSVLLYRFQSPWESWLSKGKGWRLKHSEALVELSKYDDASRLRFWLEFCE